MTTGNALPCCCDSAAPCTSLDLENLPESVNVSISIEVEYQCSFWRRENFAYHTYYPDPNGSAGPGCDQGFCYQDGISEPIVEPFAQHVATLSMNISGELPLSVATVTNGSRLFRGQLGFDYQFESDFPDTTSASGGLQPAAPSWPNSINPYAGIACVLSCTSGPGDPWARGMLRRYWGQEVASDSESVIASGPQLRLSTSYILGGAEPGGGSETPPIDSSTGLLYLVPQGIGFPPPPFGGTPRIQGLQKLAPLQTLWVRQSSPILGSYEPVRTASNAGSTTLALANGFSHFPRTRPLGSQTNLPIPSCPTWKDAHYGPANQDDPDYGSRRGGWPLALACPGELGTLSLPGTADCDPFFRAGPECPVCDYSEGFATVSNQVGFSYYPNGCAGIPPYEPQVRMIRSERMRIASMTCEVS